MSYEEKSETALADEDKVLVSPGTPDFSSTGEESASEVSKSPPCYLLDNNKFCVPLAEVATVRGVEMVHVATFFFTGSIRMSN